MRILLALLVGLVAAMTTVSGAGCAAVSGDYTTRAYVGTDCPTLVPQCFHAQTHGDVEGPARSYLRSAVPAPTPEQPTRTIWHVSHEFALIDGTISTNDVAVIDVMPVGPSPVDITLAFVAGTGAYEGISGFLRGIATFDFGAGTGEGTYSGYVCV